MNVEINPETGERKFVRIKGPLHYPSKHSELYVPATKQQQEIGYLPCMPKTTAEWKDYYTEHPHTEVVVMDSWELVRKAALEMIQSYHDCACFFVEDISAISGRKITVDDINKFKCAETLRKGLLHTNEKGELWFTEIFNKAKDTAHRTLHDKHANVKDSFATRNECKGTTFCSFCPEFCSRHGEMEPQTIFGVRLAQRLPEYVNTYMATTYHDPRKQSDVSCTFKTNEEAAQGVFPLVLDKRRTSYIASIVPHKLGSEFQLERQDLHIDALLAESWALATLMNVFAEVCTLAVVPRSRKLVDFIHDLSEKHFRPFVQELKQKKSIYNGNITMLEANGDDIDEMEKVALAWNWFCQDKIDKNQQFGKNFRLQDLDVMIKLFELLIMPMHEMHGGGEWPLQIECESEDCSEYVNQQNGKNVESEVQEL